MRLPPGHSDEGLRAALEVRARRPRFPVLVLSQYVERLYARELLASAEGGVGYLLKDRVSDVDDFVAAGATVAAERALNAAESAGDLLRICSTIRCQSEVQMRADNFNDAGRMALSAVVGLESWPTAPTSEAWCLRGASLLSAAAAAARRGDAREAKMALHASYVCAEALGEDIAVHGTVFGPTNVAIHEVAVAAELGDWRGALDRVPEVDLSRMPSSMSERRGRFIIDVARAFTAVNDDTAALGALLHAEREAPEEMWAHRHSRRIVRQLLERGRQTPELIRVADRFGVPA